MDICFNQDEKALSLESESVAEYWQLSQLSKDAQHRQKECDGKKIKLTFYVETSQDARTSPPK